MTPKDLEDIADRMGALRNLGSLGADGIARSQIKERLLWTDLPLLIVEVERLTEHSKTLNAVAFKLAEALGDVKPGQERTEGNPVELAERLIAEWTKQNNAINWDTTCFGCAAEREASYASFCRAEKAEQERDDALAKLREAQDRPWQNQ